MASNYNEILLEAEAFDNYGGWTLDSQFELEMGSPYLLAHGNGNPVADATTTISITEPGQYNVWVRAKDWVPGHHPGRFTLAINGTTLPPEFGANDRDWSWEFAGHAQLSVGEVKFTLHDLTGFCGRCDAIYLSMGSTPPPADAGRSWRRHLRGLPEEPVDAGRFDVVVVGGGIVGAVAALATARLGERVALVHDRPYLGGNGSVEIGLRPRGVTGPLIDELSRRHPDGDLYAKDLLDAEPNATVLLEHTVYDAVTSADSRIVSVDARHAGSGKETRLTAHVFIDCSGKSILALYTGARTLFGQESRAEYNEPLAPPKADGMHHGNTVFFRTRMAHSPVPFPDVPWATEVAKDFSDLRGQLTKPGIVNGPGPQVIPPNHTPDPSVRRRMKGPLTHFWEYGQWMDPYTQSENIRDHLLRAIYGTFSNVKRMESDTYANLELEWVAYVPAQGEFRRYEGDYILTENDIRSHKQFADAVVLNDGAFCLHYPGNDKYDFRLKYWEWDERDKRPYGIPFRCLYSVNTPNLMMAGKHISVTHVAGSNTKFMGNGGQHAIATAAAAHLCRKYSTTPRDLADKHLQELKQVAASITGTDVDSFGEEAFKAKL
ncbi:FAD dependent oxidoreductase-domain-containing protein [Aspergillus avenaceus]|uniref:FAD dependent oxidoreductase-domain-containing protein n=1 Tax=Aspergillus avenaceus TaxID=36643 RepID=A0A5N6U0C8_ASPAV|nr:FAD dependent oxidoreductase-domain-containing protein [Aspergillus avenaceus]